MKSFLVSTLFIAAATLAFAGSFKSRFIGQTPPDPVHIAENEFMLIRNFTQDGEGQGNLPRGFVTYNEDSGNVIKILDAAIVNSAAPAGSEEVINSIIVAGPARVRFVCGREVNCFVTYKIDSN